MLDLRQTNQRYGRFYIYKYDKYYLVGINGTSIHTKIHRVNSKRDKQAILQFINKNYRG